MVRLPPGFHPQAYRPGNRLSYGPGWRGTGARPITPIGIRAYTQKASGVPLTGGQGQSQISGGSGTPVSAPIQAVAFSAASLTTATATLAPTTAGNCLVVCFGSNAGTTNPQISAITLGGSADNWQAARTAYNSSFSNAAVWVDPDCAGGQTAVAITCTGGTGLVPGIAGYVFEVPGVQAVPVDQGAGANSGATAWSTGATGALAQASEIAFGVVGTPTSSVAINGPAAPWVLETKATVSGALGVLAGYQLPATAAALTYAGTFGSNENYGAAIATLKGNLLNPGALPAGEGIVTVGPQGLGTIWYPTQVTISTTSGLNDNSTFNVYMGPNGVPNVLVGTLFPGGSGTVPLAVPSMSPGQYLIGIWTGGKAGDICSMNVLGTMDALTTG